MAQVVQKTTPTDLLWNWDDPHPFFVYQSGGYGRNCKVDPCEAYPHEASFVSSEVEAVSALFPVNTSVVVYSLDREIIGRTNAFTDFGCDYDESKKVNGLYPWDAQIILSGKRIPIHPAMTRYLVAHEYGHVVRMAISRRRGDKNEYGLYKEYAALRDVQPVVFGHYGPGKWHERVEEVFANDFRILVAAREVEFWPHPGIDRPESVQAIVDFWDRERAFANQAAAEKPAA